MAFRPVRGAGESYDSCSPGFKAYISQMGSALALHLRIARDFASVRGAGKSHDSYPCGSKAYSVEMGSALAFLSSRNAGCRRAVVGA